MLQVDAADRVRWRAWRPAADPATATRSPRCPIRPDRVAAAQDLRRKPLVAHTLRDFARRLRPKAGNTLPAPCGRRDRHAVLPRHAKFAAPRADSCRSKG